MSRLALKLRWLNPKIRTWPSSCSRRRARSSGKVAVLETRPAKEPHSRLMGTVGAVRSGWYDIQYERSVS